MSVRMYINKHNLFHLFSLTQTNAMEMYMPNEILKLEEDVIRDEEFISMMDDSDNFRSLSEIVSEITEILSININQ